MEAFDIHPVPASALPDVAKFLHARASDQEERSAIRRPHQENALTIENRLRWLLLENPVAQNNANHGLCVRDQSGNIRGLDLCFPAAFLAGEHRIFGLCSGGFFVEPQARVLGYYLFKKYLSTPGYTLFFATTCNVNSAAIWGRLRGSHVPNSNLEYVLPLRLDRLLEGVAARNTSWKIPAGLARLCGRLANPALRLLHSQTSKVRIELCRDWQKLSNLFHRHRRRDRITTDRSPEFLEWRYGRSLEPGPSGVYLFSDTRGNEGWFALGQAVRGREVPLRGSILLDLVCPTERISFPDILPEILRLTRESADVISFRPRAGIDYGEYSPCMIRRRWPAPSAFAISRRGSPPVDISSFDLVPADGDSALPNSPWVRSPCGPLSVPNAPTALPQTAEAGCYSAQGSSSAIPIGAEA